MSSTATQQGTTDKGDGTAPAAKDAADNQFDINTIDIRGPLVVKIMASRRFGKREVARVELNIFDLLDCLVGEDNDAYYRQPRYFPLFNASELIPAEFDEMARFMKSSMSEQLSYGPFGYNRPCIKLRIRWLPNSDLYTQTMMTNPLLPTEVPAGPTMDATPRYWRMQLPSISVAIVDSKNSRELMQISLNGLDYRGCYIPKQIIDQSMVVISFQIDNQLSDATAQVLLAATPKKRPLPVARFFVRQNQTDKQTSTLTSIEHISVYVEELDLKLEQEMVLACGAVLQDAQESLRRNGAVGAENERGFSLLNLLGLAQLMQTADSAGLAAGGGGGGGGGTGSVLSPLPKHGADGPGAVTLAAALSSSHANVAADAAASALEASLQEALGYMDDMTGKNAHSLMESDDVNKIYVNKFVIAAIKINVTFIVSSHVTATHRSRWGKRPFLMKDSNGQGFFSAIILFLWQIGEIVLDLSASIADAPIVISFFGEDNLFKTNAELTTMLSSHYLNSILWQLYKIVGSLELVGNPLGLVSSLGTGVKDFFYEPVHALYQTREIKRFGKLAVKGASSLVGHAADGFIGTGTTFTRNLGRTITLKGTFDEAFMRRRIDLHQLPRTKKDIVMRPLRDIGNGVYFGIVGVVKIPYLHWKRTGLKGLPEGIAKGLTGLWTKVLVGSLDAVTHTGDAVREIVKFVTRESDKPVYRQRMSNNFGPDGRLLEYSFNRALGTYIIWVLESEKRENLNLGVAIEEGVGFIAKFGAMITGGAKAARPRGAAAAAASAAQRKAMVDAKRPSWRRVDALEDLPRVDEEEDEEEEEEEGEEDEDEEEEEEDEDEEDNWEDVDADDASSDEKAAAGRGRVPGGLPMPARSVRDLRQDGSSSRSRRPWLLSFTSFKTARQPSQWSGPEGTVNDAAAKKRRERPEAVSVRRRVTRAIGKVLFGSAHRNEATGKGRTRGGAFAEGSDAPKEHVVHTSILKQSTDATVGSTNLLGERAAGIVEKIIVVTTQRVIVTQLTRRPNNSFVKCLWQGKLRYLRRPKFEKDGAGASLILHISRRGRDKAMKDDNERSALRCKVTTVWQEQETLQVLFNCICAVMDKIALIIPIHHISCDEEFEVNKHACGRPPWRPHFVVPPFSFSLLPFSCRLSHTPSGGRRGREDRAVGVHQPRGRGG